MERVISWVKGHPWLAGGLAVVLLLILFWPRKSSASSSTDVLGSYYAAAAASQTAAAQVQQTNLQTQASTAIAQILANRDVAINAANNASSTSIATGQYGVDTAAIDAQTQQVQSTNDTTLGVAKTQADEALGMASLTTTAETFADVAQLEEADLANAGTAYQNYVASGGRGAQYGQGPSAFRSTDVRLLGSA